MKFAAPATLLLSTAAAMAIEPRQAPDNVYVTVTNLQCQPRGTTCFYTFEVRTSPDSVPLVCSARTQASGTIPTVPAEPCSDPSVLFTFEQQGSGKPASLGVAWSSDWARGVQKTYASHVFSSGDFARDAQGTQSYVGAKQFTIGDLTTTLVIRQ